MLLAVLGNIRDSNFHPNITNQLSFLKEQGFSIFLLDGVDRLASEIEIIKVILRYNQLMVTSLNRDYLSPRPFDGVVMSANQVYAQLLSYAPIFQQLTLQEPIEEMLSKCHDPEDAKQTYHECLISNNFIELINAAVELKIKLKGTENSMRTEVILEQNSSNPKQCKELIDTSSRACRVENLSQLLARDFRCIYLAFEKKDMLVVTDLMNQGKEVLLVDFQNHRIMYNNSCLANISGLTAEQFSNIFRSIINQKLKEHQQLKISQPNAAPLTAFFAPLNLNKLNKEALENYENRRYEAAATKFQEVVCELEEKPYDHDISYIRYLAATQYKYGSALLASNKPTTAADYLQKALNNAQSVAETDPDFKNKKLPFYQKRLAECNELLRNQCSSTSTTAFN